MAGTTYTINADGNFITKMDLMANRVDELNKRLAKTTSEGKKAKETLFTLSADPLGGLIKSLDASIIKYASLAAVTRLATRAIQEYDAAGKESMAKQQASFQALGKFSQLAQGEKLTQLYAAEKTYRSGFEDANQSANTLYGLQSSGLEGLFPIISKMKSSNSIGDPGAIGPSIAAVLGNLPNKDLTPAQVFATYTAAGMVNSRDPVDAMRYGGKSVAAASALGLKLSEIATMGSIVSSGKVSTESGAEASAALMMEMERQSSRTSSQKDLLGKLRAMDEGAITSDVAKMAYRTMMSSDSIEKYKGAIGFTESQGARGTEYLSEIAMAGLEANPLLAVQAENRQAMMENEIAMEQAGFRETKQQTRITKNKTRVAGNAVAVAASRMLGGIDDSLGTDSTGLLADFHENPVGTAATLQTGGFLGYGIIKELQKQTMLLMRGQSRAPSAPKPETP